MQRLTLLLAMALGLSGCTLLGGGESAEEDLAAYLPTKNLPRGLELMDEDHPGWEFMADGMGLESNPGTVDPSTFDDEEDEGPLPIEAMVAFYVGSDEESMAIGTAARFASSESLLESLEEDCEEAESEFGAFRVLKDGAVAVVFLGMGEDMEDAVDTLASRAKSATGAKDFC